MYTSYFGLKEKPFSIAPDPRYLYMSELHREALAHLMYGISSDGCFILLTGDVGTGKTTVCRCLLAQLPANTDVALIVNPRLTVQELLETICNELGIPIDEGQESTKVYIDRLNSFLLEAHGSGRNVALLIDEAQNLSLELLEQLRLLTNLETDHKKLLKIVLLGQSELRQILEQPEATQINQRVTSRYHLLPLNREDSFAYIHHRLGVAGEREKVFSKAALSKIYERSRGIPRLMNVLGDRSLLGAYVEEKYLVSGQIVEKAAREVLGGEEGARAGGNTNKLRSGLLILLLLALAAAAGLYYFSNNPLGAKRGGAPEPLPPQTEQLSREQSSESVETTAVEMTEEEKTSIRIVPLEVND